MRHETMSNADRIACALSMEKPDRVPVVPQLTMNAALSLSGYRQAEGFTDITIAHKAMLQTFDEYGGWDALFSTMPATAIVQQFLDMQPLQFLVPGKDLDEDETIQVKEIEVLQQDDYENIIANGWEAFYFEEFPQRIAGMTPEQVGQELAEVCGYINGTCAADWTARDVNSLYGGGSAHPFFSLSLARSFTSFTEDLYFRPEIIDRVLPVMTQEVIQRLLGEVEKSGIKCVLLAEERCSTFYYPLKIFERFWWPYTVEIVDAMWSNGIVTAMHLDTDFIKNLPYWKRDLPKGSYMLQLDSTTDIFAAKELLQGHGMFHGDVPATMQAIGTPQDITDYCKRLIDEVGYDGGFILGTGCNVAPNCKPENFRAMIETPKTYELSKR